MVSHSGGRYGISLTLLLGGIVFLLVLGSVSGEMNSTDQNSVRPLDHLTPSAESLQITDFSFSPNTLAADTQTQGMVALSGGTPPFQLWFNNTAPGCGPSSNPVMLSSSSLQFNCTPTSPGSYNVHLDALDSASPPDKASQTSTLTVTNNDNNSGNGNGGGNSSKNNNNNSGFSLSSLGPYLTYAMIGAFVVFALLVALTVGVLVTAVTVRRIPRQPKGGIVCGSCHDTAPAGSKFCPACAAPLAPTKKGE
ncbi:MAG: hypothetical protein WAN87_02860 [Thermoplasmata archaeon]